MRYRVLPYRQGSKGASALAAALGGRVLKLEGSTFIPRAGDVIVNWGNTSWLAPGPNGAYADVRNHPYKVPDVSNKLKFFQLMAAADLSADIPNFWTNGGDIPDEAFPVVCRTVLAGHSGDGIVIANTRGDLVNAPLYVKYEKKKDEYRVHVGIRNDESAVIAVQRKARRLDTPDSAVNWKVRNLAGGFIYAREGVVAPSPVQEAACRALRASGLDFGAVDVIYNAEKGKAYVLEINTAPGLEGQTVNDYAAFFRST